MPTLHTHTHSRTNRVVEIYPTARAWDGRILKKAWLQWDEPRGRIGTRRSCLKKWAREWVWPKSILHLSRMLGEDRKAHHYCFGTPYPTTALDLSPP
uniref:Uncharacterized protein n=1 Tax=Physcomitrium patens TaxID=3218 RepID=A0A2K1JKH8_PHYPA|nr:hypothetical protein PHYPA_016858 [Physcomitrium patens]